MKKMNILRNNGKTVNIEYDDAKYLVYYENYDEWLILKNKETKNVVFIFDGNVDFIVECDIDGKANFMVSSYGKTEYGYYDSKLRHYVDNGGPTLELVRSFSVENTELKDCRVAKNCFLVDSDYNSGKLYNLKKISKKYSCVDYDSCDFPVDKIAVSDIVYSTIDRKMTDEITYAVDLDNFELASPIIRSREQKAIFNIYNQNQIFDLDIRDIEYLETTKNCDIEKIDPFEVTVYCEVIKNLDNKVNEKALKKLKMKK